MAKNDSHSDKKEEAIMGIQAPQGALEIQEGQGMFYYQSSLDTISLYLKWVENMPSEK